MYPFNCDASQRLCEIEFLRDKPIDAIKYTKGELYENDYHNVMRFWGLVYGKLIFQAFSYLQAGDFNSAKQIVQNTRWDTKGGYLLRLIPELFNGSYSSAVNRLQQNENCRPTPFTIAERRILYARALLLNILFSEKKNNEELKRSKFYFQDLSKNSLLLDHLAKVSEAYFFATDGNLENAITLSKKAFSNLLKKSKGDMITKLWLFYDSFIYAKTMELIDNKDEAIRGYKECIKANPYTDLAKRSTLILKNSLR